MKDILGILRSIGIYHRSAHLGAMTQFYGRFVRPGSLVFDIGAHVGDRTRAFLRLGCRVIAVEANPKLARLLKILYFRDPAVAVVAAAVSDVPGVLTFNVNSSNPAVSTASAAFIGAATAGAPGW